MTEEVATTPEGTSEGTEATPATGAAEAAPTTTPDDEATWQKRLAGKDQALTRTIQERDAAAKRVAELEDWKNQQERGSLTELERMRLELEDKDRRLAEAQQQATAAKLEARFPNAYAQTDGKLLDEGTLAKLESALTSREEPGHAPTVPNSAPKRPPEPPRERSADDIEAELRTLPNPFSDTWTQRQ